MPECRGSEFKFRPLVREENLFFALGFHFLGFALDFKIRARRGGVDSAGLIRDLSRALEDTGGVFDDFTHHAAHARFEKVEKVPSNDEAQDNVLYLVMNAATGYYDIYAKVGEEVVRLDDTTVDLSNYATIEQLNAVSGGIGGTVYAGTKEDLSASDDSVIAAYFKAHTDVAVKKGDVFVVTTTVRSLETKGLLIKEYSATDINADPARIGFPGSPTKVKQVMSVVLTASEAKSVPATAEGINELIHELISDHTLG